jgi:hypothetical protein
MLAQKSVLDSREYRFMHLGRSLADEDFRG